ncbi:hypothetical protein AAVH_28630 [Aphelenchoides avenae]|nr:hypothetical protein AAVH_28630 [Aphelenchus avenae]
MRQCALDLKEELEQKNAELQVERKRAHVASGIIEKLRSDLRQTGQRIWDLETQLFCKEANLGQGLEKVDVYVKTAKQLRDINQSLRDELAKRSMCQRNDDRCMQRRLVSND